MSAVVVMLCPGIPLSKSARTYPLLPCGIVIVPVIVVFFFPGAVQVTFFPTSFCASILLLYPSTWRIILFPVTACLPRTNPAMSPFIVFGSLGCFLNVSFLIVVCHLLELWHRLCFFLFVSCVVLLLVVFVL